MSATASPAPCSPDSPEDVPQARCSPVMSDHRRLGILSGDFIKPDAALTQSETRAHVLKELESWLTGRICTHAKEVAAAYPDPSELSYDLVQGTWPAVRLYMVLRMLESTPSVVLPADALICNR